ncbi:MAG: hypothetical protein WD042_13430 [Phycisphaeraceae bacterium]
MSPCLLVCLSLFPGCAARIGGSSTPEAALNDMRRENQELRQQVQQLLGNIDLRLAEIDTLEQQLHRPAGHVPDAKVPQAVAIKFGRYSGAVDSDNDGKDDLIRVYIQPHDQKDRFLPIAAQAVVQVASIQPDAGARLLAEKTFDAQPFDHAYRSGLTGTHYALELPLPDDFPDDLKEVTVKVTLTNAATGATLTAQQAVVVKR